MSHLLCHQRDWWSGCHVFTCIDLTLPFHHFIFLSLLIKEKSVCSPCCTMRLQVWMVPTSGQVAPRMLVPTSNVFERHSVDLWCKVPSGLKLIRKVLYKYGQRRWNIKARCTENVDFNLKSFFSKWILLTSWSHLSGLTPSLGYAASSGHHVGMSSCAWHKPNNLLPAIRLWLKCCSEVWFTYMFVPTEAWVIHLALLAFKITLLLSCYLSFIFLVMRKGSSRSDKISCFCVFR